MLPALITLLPYKKQTSQAFMDKVMSNLAEFVIAQKNFLIITTTAVIVFLGFGITQLKLEDDFLRYFDTKYELRQATDYYENNVGGLNALEYNIRTQSDSGINDIEYLNKVDQLIAYMRAQPEISSVRGYTDVLKRLNQNMNGDDKSFYKIPDTNIEAAQYLFLYELSLAYGLDLTDQINIDKSGLRLTAYVPNTTSSAFLNLDLRIQNWMAENAPELNTPATGQSVVYNKISSRDAPAMLKGTGYALIGISFIILLVLRNIKYGIISLIPNLLPAVMAFGLWGYSVGSVTLAVSIVVAMTLGIVVDDSVHFMLKYAKARKKGLSPEDSVRDSFKNVGMALTITSIGLVIGFSILAQSGFAVNKDMAMLTAITIGFALFVDYLLLPPILMAVDKFNLRRQIT
jgi:predicted RND superfamily exporter protein